MTDSGTGDLQTLLINVPVSTPLHPQANLPFLAGFLKQEGYRVQAIDANIGFFRWILDAEAAAACQDPALLENPVRMLECYAEVEAVLAEKAAAYRGLSLDLRGVQLAYDRIHFDQVLAALDDREANPFLPYFESLLDEHLAKAAPRIIGIGLAFQDHVIAAFTLARLVRQRLPEAKIVLGGQMITRCHDTLTADGSLDSFWDYLVLWDGELPLLDIHRKEIDGQDVSMRNVIAHGATMEVPMRAEYGFDLDSLANPDFSDIDFGAYLYPDAIVPLQTARGCYAECQFCAIPQGSNTGFRQRGVERLLDDIETVREQTRAATGQPATYFKFMDDTSSAKKLLRFAEAVEERGLPIQWETFTRLDKAFASREVMDQLYRGGCRKLMWGLETNDPDVLSSMDKRINPGNTTRILQLAADAGILNFVFVLVGFPGETRDARDRLADYIIEHDGIHVLTIATFDLTKHSPMQRNFYTPNPWGLDCEPAVGFEVRLPYTVNGRNWKDEQVAETHRVLHRIIDARPDIGFMSLFPDQVRGKLCHLNGNTWGRDFLERFGRENIRKMLTATEDYMRGYGDSENIVASLLPEPLRREHHRTKEDIAAISRAISSRRRYQDVRIKQL